jgi:hypothetical protein
MEEAPKDVAAAPAADGAPDQATAELPINERAAIIFVPGISRSWAEHSLSAVADDIIVALNSRSPLAHSASGVGTQSYGTGASPPVARHITLSRTTEDSGTQTEAIVDLYEFDYTRRLAERFEEKNLVLRAVLVLMAIIRGAFTLRRNAPSGAKTFVERLQVWLLLGMLFLYAFLLVALTVAIATQALELIGSIAGGGGTDTPPTGGQTSPTPVPSPAEAGTGGGPLSAVAEWFGVAADSVIAFALPLAALLWLLLPPRARIKQFLTNAATDYLAIDYYLRGQEGAEELHGGLRSLMGTLGDRGYRRIDLVSYSFGSVVAFNVVFSGQPPDPAGPVSAVEGMVTIGSPYDLVRRIRPKYFTARHALADHPKRWINIYVPNDVLGSNFRNDTLQGEPAAEVIQTATAPGGGLPMPHNVVYLPGGVPREGPTAADLIGFRGVQVHAQYWDPGQRNESTCFDEVVVELYRDDPVLSG